MEKLQPWVKAILCQAYFQPACLEVIVDVGHKPSVRHRQGQDGQRDALYLTFTQRAVAATDQQPVLTYYAGFFGQYLALDVEPHPQQADWIKATLLYTNAQGGFSASPRWAHLPSRRFYTPVLPESMDYLAAQVRDRLNGQGADLARPVLMLRQARDLPSTTPA